MSQYTEILSKAQLEVVRKLIRYSFEDIETFAELSKREQNIIKDPTLFALLKSWAIQR